MRATKAPSETRCAGWSHPMRPRSLRGGVAAVLAVLGAAILGTGCGGTGGSSGPPPLFYVTSSDPPPYAQFVPVNKVFRILFNEAVDPASIDASTIEVRATQTNTVTPGQTTLDSLTMGIVWVPDGPLPGPLAHVLRISPTLRSATGHTVGGPLEIRFTTEAPADDGLPSAEDLRALVSRLAVGRRSHRATLLNDGTVLLTGGFKAGSTITDRVEVFDTPTETFRTLPARMVVGRAGHTATLLSDGRVLICGGWVETSPGVLDETDTAEVFQPGSQTFVAVGDMVGGRVDHAAFRLPTGRVLVTGGSTLESTPDGDFLFDFDDAQVFDPVSGTFSAHPELMAHAHSTHDMVATANGQVVIAGGSSMDLRAELLDPATGTFTPFPTVPGDAGRFGAAMERFDSGGIVVVGGDLVGTVLYVAPDGSRIQNTGSGLSKPRSYATASRFAPDEILVAGGLDVGGGLFISSSCDLLREGGPGGSQTRATHVRFFTGMAMHTATRLRDDRILFCGGLNATGGAPELDRAYIFDPK